MVARVSIFARVAFVLGVFIVAVACCAFLTPFSYPLILLGELPAYRLLLGAIQTVFCVGCACLIQLCLRTDLTLVASPDLLEGLDDDAPGVSVLLCNHPTRLDWMYVWASMAMNDCPPGASLPELRIVLKGELKKAPLLGWFMQQNNYLFLRRNFEQDKHHLAAMSAHVAR